MKKPLLQPGGINRRDLLKLISIPVVRSLPIFSSDSGQLPSGIVLDELVGIEQEPGVRTLESNEMYTLKLHSRWYQQGDLIVAELEPHVPLQDSTFNFSVNRPDGTTRKLSLPQLILGGKTFVFLGADHTYPVQNAKLDLKVISRGRNISKSYEVIIKILDGVRTENFSSATTQNAEPKTQEDIKSIERENRLLIPAWQDYTTKLPYVTGKFQLPRPVCDLESFSARRVYDGELRSRHNGIDCTGNITDVIKAALPGKIVCSEDGFFYMGNTVMIQHGFGLYTLYAHMNRRNVQEGEVVLSGQNIGEIGKSGRVTGPHLHWQAKLYGMNMDPKSLEVLNYIFK